LRVLGVLPLDRGAPVGAHDGVEGELVRTRRISYEDEPEDGQHVM